MKRRTFLEVISAGAGGVLTGGLPRLMAAISEARDSTFELGGDLLVNRLGFGAMRLTGEGIWGWPPDRENAKKVLRRALELGVNFIDTADAYGRKRTSSSLPKRYIPIRKDWSSRPKAVTPGPVRDNGCRTDGRNI